MAFFSIKGLISTAKLIILFSRQSQGLETTKKMGGLPALQAFSARHYIGKKARKENEQIEMFCKYLITVGEN